MWAPKLCGAVDDKGQQKRAAIPRQHLTGQYIGIIPANARAMPISDSIFGKKLAIHAVPIACQSKIGGLPTEIYP